MSEFLAIAAQYGPIAGFVVLLFRSNAAKDKVIERMGLQLIEAVTAQKEVIRATREVVKSVGDKEG